MRAQFFILPTIFIMTVFILLFIENTYHPSSSVVLDTAKQYGNVFNALRFIKSVSHDVVNVSMSEVLADNNATANTTLRNNIDSFVTRSQNLTSPLDTYSLTYTVNAAACTQMDVTYTLSLISNDLNVSDRYSVLCTKTQCNLTTGISCYGY